MPAFGPVVPPDGASSPDEVRGIDLPIRSMRSYRSGPLVCADTRPDQFVMTIGSPPTIPPALHRRARVVREVARTAALLGRLKDWGHVASRCNTCAKVFLSAIAPDAAVISWL